MAFSSEIGGGVFGRFTVWREPRPQLVPFPRRFDILVGGLAQVTVGGYCRLSFYLFDSCTVGGLYLSFVPTRGRTRWESGNG
jgi:hypothetical protein